MNRVVALLPNVAVNFTAACLFALLGFLVSDVLFGPPRIHGFWSFEVRFSAQPGGGTGEAARIDLALVPLGDGLAGTGRKLGSAEAGGRPVASEAIVVDGHMDQNYLFPDRVVLRLQDQADDPDNTCFFELELHGDRLIGKAIADGGQRIGSVMGKRVYVE